MPPGEARSFRFPLLSSILLSLVLLLCAPAASARTFFDANTTSVRVGLLLDGLEAPLDDALNPVRAAAAIGVASAQAAGLLPGISVEIVDGVTGGRPEAVSLAVKHARDEGAAAVVGSHSATQGRAAAFAASWLGVNVVSPSGGAAVDSPAADRYTAMGVTVGRTCDAALRTCVALGWTRVGLLTDHTMESHEYATEFRERGAALGVEVAAEVRMALNPELERDAGADLGDLSVGLDQVRDAPARVWVCLIGPDFTTRVADKAREAGVLGDPLGRFTWLFLREGLLSLQDEVDEGAAETMARVATSFEGALFLVPYAYNDSFAALDGFATEVEAGMASAAGLASVDGAGVRPDAVALLGVHDTMAVLLHALDALRRLHEWCDGGGGAGAANCTELAADGGDDDASLTRLLRAGRVAPADAGLRSLQTLGFENTTGGTVGSDQLLFVTQVNGDPTGSRPFVPVLAYTADASAEPLALGASFVWGGADPSAPPADRPTTVRRVLGVSDGSVAVTFAVSTASLAWIAAVAGATLYYAVVAQRPIMRMTSFRLNLVAAAGGAGFVLAPVVFALRPVTSATCVGGTVLYWVCHTAVLMPAILKLWRIKRVMCRGGTDGLAPRRAMPDSLLFRVLAVALCGDLALMTVWVWAGDLGVDELWYPVVATEDPNVYVAPVLRLCSNAMASGPFLMAFGSYKAAMLFVGARLAFQTRHVSVRALSEAHSTGALIYMLVAVCSVLGAVLVLLPRSRTGAMDVWIVTLLCYCAVAALATVAVMALPPLLAIWTGHDHRWTSMGSANRRSGSKAATALATPSPACAVGRRLGDELRAPASRAAAGAKVAPAPRLLSPEGENRVG